MELPDLSDLLPDDEPSPARVRALLRGRPTNTADVVKAYLKAHYAYPAPDITTQTYTEPRRWLRDFIGGPEWSEHRDLLKAWGRTHQPGAEPNWAAWCRASRWSESTAERRVEQAIQRIADLWDLERLKK